MASNLRLLGVGSVIVGEHAPASATELLALDAELLVLDTELLETELLDAKLLLLEDKLDIELLDLDDEFELKLLELGVTTVRELAEFIAELDTELSESELSAELAEALDIRLLERELLTLACTLLWFVLLTLALLKLILTAELTTARELAELVTTIELVAELLFIAPTLDELATLPMDDADKALDVDDLATLATELATELRVDVGIGVGLGAKGLITSDAPPPPQAFNNTTASQPRLKRYKREDLKGCISILSRAENDGSELPIA